jgi:uncharacterized Ntn-hydrolase superfamily protein
MTYSIVARDPASGELGVAVQSRAFRTGGSVPWAWPGVGAVATQAFGEGSYGPLGLELLQAGKSPAQALAGLVAADPDHALRQVAILGGDGTAAVHTGRSCIAAAGHAVGEGYAVQANMVRGEDVWRALAVAFESARGTLAQRLLAALEAAEAAGGDFRGRQAAGLLVVPALGQRWERVSDLRVDDHPDPLVELRRLLRKEEAYRRLNRLPEHEPPEEAFEQARSAGIPEDELAWYGAVLAWKAGRRDELESRLRPLVDAEPRWQGALDVLLAHDPP